jgi:hypothetical protein
MADATTVGRRDDGHMGAWSTRVEDPFRSDHRFWRAVGLSVDALLAVAVVVVVAVFVGAIALVALVVPAALLAIAAWQGTASTADSRPTFTGRVAWRDAERRAVAAALPGAFLRPRWGRSR